MKYLIIILSLAAQTAFCQPDFEPRADKGILNTDRIREASGLAAGRVNSGILWTHNDSGDSSIVYAINTNAQLAAEFRLKGYHNTDFEDIASGPGPESGVNYLYLADIGDNNAVRKYITVLRFKEPKFQYSPSGPYRSQIDVPDSIRFKYPDGSRDAESIFIDPLTLDIYIISKRENYARVYRAQYPYYLNETRTLDFITELPFGNEGLDNSGVTAADISPDGSEILIKTYFKLYYFKRNEGESIKKALEREPAELKYIPEPQGEGLCWDHSGKGFYTISEEYLGIKQHLYYYAEKSSGVNVHRDKGHFFYIEGKNIIIDNELDDYSGMEVSIFDSAGNRSTATHHSFSGSRYTLDISRLPEGAYFIIMKNGRKFYTGKFIKEGENL